MTRRVIQRAERTSINREFASVDAFIHEYVANVSASGAFIRSKEPLAVGTEVNLTFSILMDEVETVHGVGEVVRVQKDPPGMGVVFTRLSSRSRAIIDRLLVRARAKASPRRPRGGA